MCFTTKASTTETSAGPDARTVNHVDQEAAITCEEPIPVDPKLQKLYKEMDRIAEEVSELEYQWDLYTVSKAIGGCLKACDGFFKAASPAPPVAKASSDNEQWYSNFQLFLHHLDWIEMSHTPELRAQVDAAVPSDEEPLSEEEWDRVQAQFHRLEDWCEERRECLKLSAQVYKENLARYINARIDRDLVPVPNKVDEAEGEAAVSLASATQLREELMDHLLPALAVCHTEFCRFLLEWPAESCEGEKTPRMDEIRGTLAKAAELLK